MARNEMGEEPVLPKKCLKCGGPLQVQAFDDVRVSVGDSEPMEYPAAFCQVQNLLLSHIAWRPA